LLQNNYVTNTIQGGDFNMFIGVPKEIKNNENRVALTPAGVEAFKKAGHHVLIETGAGLGSGFTDEEYIASGAEIIPTHTGVFAAADMIIKVKEPLPGEYDLFKEEQILLTYLHLAPEPELTRALMKKRVIGIAYETIQLPDGSLPLLTPMSEVAGRMSIQIGAQFLEKPHGGKGILLGGVPGVPAAKVTIVGGGIVGTNAAKMALGLGADVTILDLRAPRLRYLDDIFGARIKTLMSNSYNLKQAVSEADLVVGAVLIPGAKAPKLVTEEMVKSMKPGSVIVDVAIDQGGCIETIDRVTTHAEPTFVKHGVVHYSVANMPGAVARTSTFALTNVTLPYALEIANKGYLRAMKENPSLAKGVNVIDGKLTYQAVADALNLEYTALNECVL
jgi:alanine dehydrogenase